jgi:hypothetical protein
MTEECKLTNFKINKKKFYTEEDPGGPWSRALKQKAERETERQRREVEAIRKRLKKSAHASTM